MISLFNANARSLHLCSSFSCHLKLFAVRQIGQILWLFSLEHVQNNRNILRTIRELNLVQEVNRCGSARARGRDDEILVDVDFRRRQWQKNG